MPNAELWTERLATRFDSSYARTIRLVAPTSASASARSPALSLTRRPGQQIKVRMTTTTKESSSACVPPGSTFVIRTSAFDLAAGRRGHGS